MQGVVTVTINGQVQWQIRCVARDIWIGECDPLGLVLEGDSEEELRSLIGEGTHALFLDLLKGGELQAFLRDHGWSVSSPIPPAVPNEGVVFVLPTTIERAAA